MTEHVPVLLREVVELMELKKDLVVVDGTLGMAGHTRALLEAEPSLQLYGFDLDTDNLAKARKYLEDYPHVTTIHSSFAHLEEALRLHNVQHIDRCLLDLGLCSTHVDDAEKGFSFMKDGPLDMRFNRTTGKTAKDVLMELTEEELADIFFRYGEEPKARKFARTIVGARTRTPLDTTTQLADLLLSVSPVREKKHPATRVFQALRIYVNNELGALEAVLTQALRLLTPGGRLAIISYHSLEDRIVKQTFASLVPLQKKNKYGTASQDPWTLVTKHPVVPSPSEISANPRARSAKLRVIQKLI